MRPCLLQSQPPGRFWPTTCWIGHRSECNREKRTRIVKNKLSVLMLLAGGTLFAQVSIGIRIGAPPPPRVIRVSREVRAPDIFGWQATGIRPAIITNGTMDIGRSRLTKEHAGWRRVTMDSDSSKVTGTAVEAISRTIISGTNIGIISATTIAITTGTSAGRAAAKARDPAALQDGILTPRAGPRVLFEEAP